VKIAVLETMGKKYHAGFGAVNLLLNDQGSQHPNTLSKAAMAIFKPSLVLTTHLYDP
jgi:hypothetical protein